ncbi:MAG TPA: hypothetical protein GXZ68_06690 [Firmicutes bacterium]|nr:hypothetical protein [Bacillota bacterium]
MKSICALWKTPRRMLVCALLLILVSSFLAGLFHTSFYSVKIERIEFATERGTLSALLYMPKGAGANDSRPVIITTHGYLNTKEMQDAPAIEMSRRGYIVLALDMYDHGDSRWAGDIPVGGHFGTFWIYAQSDAAKYVYEQPYTKKDGEGNAYVSVSGHSMGGFSSFIALYMDEMQALQTGYRMIYTGISVGSDFSYAAAVATQDQYQAAFGSRTVGMIAAHYDEFFFNKSEQERTASEKAVSGTVTYKDFPATMSGKSFLGLDPTGPAGEAGRFYTVPSGDLLVNDQVVRSSEEGRHIIYTPNQTHPWNHFSKATTANLIDFYTEAFAGVTSPNQTNVNLSSANQIWALKEAFNFLSLVGFVILILGLARLLITAPFFKEAVVPAPAVLAVPKSRNEKIVSWVVVIIATLLPAIFFPALFNKSAEGMAPLLNASYVVLALCAFCILAALARSKGELASARNATIQGVVIALFAGALALWIGRAPSLLPLGRIFNQPTTNQIAYWAVASGLIAALINVLVYYLDKKRKGTTFESYGITFKPMVIVASLATALVTVVASYVVLWIMQALFTVDFRVWTLAVRTFKLEHVYTALRYLPFFFIFYLINVIVVNANSRGLKRWGYLVAVLLNTGGLILWLLRQYGTLFITGVAAYPTENLNGILLFALVPILGLAGVYSRKLFEETGNVWLAAFLNTILFTMITVANTAMFWNFV